jgi:hypothetical protein
METTLEELCGRLEPMLFGFNYCVFLKVYRCDIGGDATPLDAIQKVLGAEAIPGGLIESNKHELRTEIDDCIRFRGDEGSGPDLLVLDSNEFKEAVTRMVTALEVEADRASKIYQFWLKEGHPDYPVFWDYAYVLMQDRRAVVLVGSSSD